MKKAQGLGFVVGLVILVLIIVLVVVLAYKTRVLGTAAPGYIGACSGDVEIKSSCYCGGVKVSGGYCCNFVQSGTPCFCSERNVNKCSDYKSEECAKNECLVAAMCHLEGDVCK